MQTKLSPKFAGLLVANSAFTWASAPHIAGIAQLTVPQRMELGLSHQTSDFASIEGGEVEAAMDHTQLKIALNINETASQVTLLGLSISRMEFRLNENNMGYTDEAFYSISLPLTIVDLSDDKWTRIIEISPSIHSNMDVIDQQAFSLTGIALWDYQASETSNWNIGAGVSRVFGEYVPFPIISYASRVQPNFEFIIGFPETKVEYRYKENWSSFVSLGPNGGVWRYQEDKDSENVNLTYSSWEVFAGVRYQIEPQIWSTLKIGKTFERKLNYDEGSDTDLRLATSNTIMFTLGYHP